MQKLVTTILPKQKKLGVLDEKKSECLLATAQKYPFF
jgi:hypothetical protein